MYPLFFGDRGHELYGVYHMPEGEAPGGIGVVLFQWIRLSDYNSVGVAVWMIAIVVTILDYVSARIRERYV